MENAFRNCSNFNQPIGKWDVSSVRQFSQMLNGCTNFNQDLGNWNIENVTPFLTLFKSASNLNASFVENWNVTNACTNLNEMFRGVGIIGTTDINHWDVSNVTTFRGCFRDTDFNGDITGWNVGSGTCLLYTSPSPRDRTRSRMPSSA